MKMRSILGALSIIALAVTPVFAEKSLEERVKRLEEALQKAQQRESREIQGGRFVPKPTPDASDGSMTDIRVGRAGEEKEPLSVRFHRIRETDLCETIFECAKSDYRWLC